MCGKIISAQGLVIDHLKNMQVDLVIVCMLCGNTLRCRSPTREHIKSVHVLPFQPRGRKLNILGKQLNHIITENELVRLLTVELPNFPSLEGCCVGEGLCGHLCKVKTWPVQ